jgi:hypothetical protein
MAVDLNLPPELGVVLERPVLEMAKEKEEYLVHVESKTLQ